MKNYIPRWIQLLAMFCRLRCNSESQRNVGHVVHNDTRVLGRCLRHPRQTRFVDMVSIQPRHFGRWLDPYLVFGVITQMLQGGNVKTEFSRFSKFSKADTDVQQILSPNWCCCFHERLANVIHTILEGGVVVSDERVGMLRKGTTAWLLTLISRKQCRSSLRLISFSIDLPIYSDSFMNRVLVSSSVNGLMVKLLNQNDDLVLCAKTWKVGA